MHKEEEEEKKTDYELLSFSGWIISLSHTHNDFCHKKGLMVNLEKTKAVIFHISTPTGWQSVFTLIRRQVEAMDSYVYLGVKLTKMNAYTSL